MAYKINNYTAFYVSEPFNENNLGASSTKDFSSYSLLKAWKGKDSSYPFKDSHDKTYNVRDGSDWERTLKPRLRERLSHSKNIILFLSSATKSSKALKEEIDYGVNTLGLPVIIVYPEYSEKNEIINCDSGNFKQHILNLWDNIPILRNSMESVPTLHIPYKKEYIRLALNDKDFMYNTKGENNTYHYPC